jgi:hypothetical protein
LSVEFGADDKTRCENAGVKTDLRKVLAESHVAAIAIAVLLCWSVGAALQGIMAPLFSAAEYLAIAVTIRGGPSVGPDFFRSHALQIAAAAYVLNAAVDFAAAWLLARWVYGDGPFTVLRRYRRKIARRNNT